MPQKARIDAPGALQHIICRGIEDRQTFADDADRDNFVERLGQVLTETKIPCNGWALLPNLFHLLLRTGALPV
jgi:putative transposase